MKEHKDDTRNVGRALDPFTGKQVRESFSYPTYYVSDTHHLALRDKDNKHDFVVLPNAYLPKKRMANDN